MKILHIIDKLALGGPAVRLKEIFEGQNKNSQILLYVLRRSDIMINIKHPNCNIYSSKNKFSFQPFIKLKTILEGEKVDILHCHEFRSKLFGWLLKKRFFPVTKLVFHERGDIFKNNKLYDLFLRVSTNETDLYLAVSRAAKRQLVERARIPEHKIKVLYNCLDLKKFDHNNTVWNVEAERRKIDVDKDDFVIGFAARFIERKGWRTFINAAALAIDSLPSAKFLIAGDGKDKNKLLRLIESKNLQKNIRFLGYVSDMTWFYSVVNCFVISSYWEPMGMTEIEAQAMGIPVISSNVEALNEIIYDGENGLFFEPKNEKDLAEKIIILYRDHNLRQRIIAGGLETVKEYSLSNYIENLNRLYDNLP